MKHPFMIDPEPVRFGKGIQIGGSHPVAGQKIATGTKVEPDIEITQAVPGKENPGKQGDKQGRSAPPD